MVMTHVIEGQKRYVSWCFCQQCWINCEKFATLLHYYMFNYLGGVCHVIMSHLEKNCSFFFWKHGLKIDALIESWFFFLKLFENDICTRNVFNTCLHNNIMQRFVLDITTNTIFYQLVNHDFKNIFLEWPFMLCHVLINSFNPLVIRTLFFLHFWLLITWMHLKISIMGISYEFKRVLLIISNLFANQLLQLVSQRWMSWCEIVLSFNTHCDTHSTSIVVSFFG